MCMPHTHGMDKMEIHTSGLAAHLTSKWYGATPFYPTYKYMYTKIRLNGGVTFCLLCCIIIKFQQFPCDSSILKSIRGRFKSILMENRIALNLKRTQFNRSKFNTSYLSESFRTMFAIHSSHQYISLELNEKPYTFIQAPSIFMYSITRWHCVTISLNIMLTKQRQKEKIKKKTIKSQQ